MAYIISIKYHTQNYSKKNDVCWLKIMMLHQLETIIFKIGKIYITCGWKCNSHHTDYAWCGRYEYLGLHKE